MQRRLRRRFLKSYGRVQTSYSEVHAPGSVEEVRGLLDRARREKRRLTFRGGGSSFDSQSLNDDLVVGLDRMNRILEIDPVRRRLTVEPGARWGAVVDRLLPLGLTPYVVVTTGKATAGGTLSGNCLSRSSPVFGKAGSHIECFRLLKVDGELVECSRTENPDLFRGVIGGLGYLGAVVEITYRLLEIGKRTRIRTVASRCDGFEALMDTLGRYTRDPGEYNAVYSVAFFSGRRNRGFVFRSRYTEETRFRRLLVNRPRNLFRIPIEWLIGFSAVNNLVWNTIYRHFIKDDDVFIDDLPGYTFFMDGNRVAKGIAEHLGFTMKALQQTFVVPEARVLDFLNAASEVLREDRLNPNLFDILFLPADDILLSPSHDLAGYAVSLAFEDLSGRKVAKLKSALRQLSGLCADLGGRVYLVKNVEATPEQIAAMYGPNLDRFLALKRRLDPEGILRNEFFDRLFGGRPPTRRAREDAAA